MGLLSSADLAQMAADLQSVRDDNPTSIVIRRRNTNLAAQTVRIARAGQSAGRGLDVNAMEEQQQMIVVMGDATLDIAVGDRFNDDNGELYQVTFVRPNRRAAVVAEARMIE